MEFNRTKLMLASFLTLVASGVGFATRAASGGIWESSLGIDGGQFGAIMGAGFLGFGIMIFVGGFIVEAFGYKKVLMVAFLLHLVSAAMLVMAPSLFAGWSDAGDAAAATEKVFSLLFWSAFLFSICQGLYEAVINPMIAQLYDEDKTHYLNILHAGWPAGMIIGGLFAAGFMGRDCWFVEVPWHWANASFALFVLVYGVMALPEKFPKTVSQAASNFSQLFSCFASWPFLLLIVLHGLIGYMELGVDSWVSKLLENLLPNAVIILVYTSALMFILRFFAGPIAHKINPIGLLLASSIIACLGLLWLGSGITSLAVLFAAATFYSLGKAFLWPTMLAVAGERYPLSGAIAMGALGAAGMITVGQIGGPAIGHKQGYNMSAKLEADHPETFSRFAAEEEKTFFGAYGYKPLVAEKLAAANGVKIEDGKVTNTDSISNAELLSPEDKKTMLANAAADSQAVQEANLHGGYRALTLTAYIPGAMAIGFLILLIYYKMIGGYKVLHVNKDGTLSEASPKEAH